MPHERRGVKQELCASKKCLILVFVCVIINIIYFYKVFYFMTRLIAGRVTAPVTKGGVRQLLQALPRTPTHRIPPQLNPAECPSPPPIPKKMTVQEFRHIATMMANAEKYAYQGDLSRGVKILESAKEKGIPPRLQKAFLAALNVVDMQVRLNRLKQPAAPR